MLLSLFCGAGGLDLGFEAAGFDIGLAFDKRQDSVDSYNHNRQSTRAHCEDIYDVTLERLDKLWGSEFKPEGIIGGPPCQSFSQANRNIGPDDPRHQLPLVYAELLGKLNARNPVKFFVLENVPGLLSPEHLHRLQTLEIQLRNSGFDVRRAILNALDFATPQNRARLFLIGLNTSVVDPAHWAWPVPARDKENSTVRAAIGDLTAPLFFERGVSRDQIPFHPNHWCMKPKSARFARAGMLTPGNARHRSFKTLAWDQPSITVAYGHREVHVHPNCDRRLSVYEAMLLQGFPKDYELLGSLSSQITQVSEAVPPKMAEAVARAIKALPCKTTPQQAKRKHARLFRTHSSAAFRGSTTKASTRKHRSWLKREATRCR